MVKLVGDEYPNNNRVAVLQKKYKMGVHDVE